MRDIVTRIKLSVAAIAVAGISAGIYSVATTTSAHAQTGPGSTVTNINSFGPLAIGANESIHIGLLLPAVNNISQQARLELFNSAGALLVDMPAGPKNGSLAGTQFEIEIENGTMKFLDSAGNLMITARVTDNILTGLLLPAVTQGGAKMGPLAASVQRFAADGTPLQFASFANGTALL